MNDKEKLKELLNGFGVEFKEIDNFIRCREGYKKVDGYSGFFIDFNFDESGAFDDMGAWE